MPVAKTLRREFLQLADKYDPSKAKLKIAGFYVSEKLDGTRCFWDGGITRGMKTERVPWASITDPKTGNRKSKIKPIATGLWSRYGNPIIAPDWFLNALPACPLDGELWAGRGNYQLNRSIVGGDTPDPRFDQISYAVYGSPPLASIFGTGEIKNANMVAKLDLAALVKFVNLRLETFDGDFKVVSPDATFEEELLFLREAIEPQGDRCFLHRQTKLPADETEARAKVEELLSKYVDDGAEGVVIRDPQATWIPKRHKGLLKYKPFLDSEATVVGFTSGRLTDKGSKLLGKIGALVLDYNGKRLELAGLTDEERCFANDEMTSYARHNPGIEMPGGFQGKHFTVGQEVTFIYRELSDDGVPKEARYLRQRDEE